MAMNIIAQRRDAHGIHALTSLTNRHATARALNATGIMTLILIILTAPEASGAKEHFLYAETELLTQESSAMTEIMMTATDARRFACLKLAKTFPDGDADTL